MDPLVPEQLSSAGAQKLSKLLSKFCQENLSFDKFVLITGNLTFNVDGIDVNHALLSEMVSPKEGINPSLTADNSGEGSDDTEIYSDDRVDQRANNAKLPEQATEGLNPQKNDTEIKADPDQTPAKLVITLDKSKKYKKKYKPSPLTCSMCGESFLSKVQLKKHAREKHWVEGKVCLHPCSQCKQTFFSPEDLQEHSDTAHAKPELKIKEDEEIDEEAHPKGCKCTACKTEIIERPATPKPPKRIRKRKPKGRGHFPCEHCDKVFTAQSTLYHHTRGIHSGTRPYKCTMCDQTFNFHHSMKLHILKHRGLRPYKCDSCNKSYLTASHLKGHVEAVHMAEKKFVCVICNKSFPYENSLKMHMKLHSGEKPFMCCICSKGFISKSALKVHEASHVEGKEFECSVCNKKYKTEILLKAHSRRHTSDGSRYMCDVCGNRFMFKSNLEAHYKVHGDVRSYECQECGKMFKTYATLYSHNLVHRKEYLFSCTSCDKSFKTKESLKAHERRHLGLKPFSCQLCGSCFPDKGGLSKHRKTVHATMSRYACPVCNKGSNRADNLRVHMKVHGDPSLLKIAVTELEVHPANDSSEIDSMSAEMDMEREKPENASSFYYKQSQGKAWSGGSAQNPQFYRTQGDLIAERLQNNHSAPSLQANSIPVSTPMVKTTTGLVPQNTAHLPPNSLYFMQNQAFSIVNDGGRGSVPVAVNSNTLQHVSHSNPLIQFPMPQENFN